MDVPPMLTVADVMKFLNVGDPDTIYSLIRSGRLPAIRLGRRYRILEEDLKTLMRGGNPATPTPPPPPALSGNRDGADDPDFPEAYFPEKIGAAAGDFGRPFAAMPAADVPEKSGAPAGGFGRRAFAADPKVLSFAKRDRCTNPTKEVGLPRLSVIGISYTVG